MFLTPNIFVEDLSNDPLQFGGKEGQLELQFLQQNVLIITLVVRIVTIAMYRKDGGLMNTRAGTRLFKNRRLIEYLKEATRSARLGTRSVLGAAGKVEI